jgi:hypothetical protein
MPPEVSICQVSHLEQSGVYQHCTGCRSSRHVCFRSLTAEGERKVGLAAAVYGLVVVVLGGMCTTNARRMRHSEGCAGWTHNLMRWELYTGIML